MSASSQLVGLRVPPFNVLHKASPSHAGDRVGNHLDRANDVPIRDIPYEDILVDGTSAGKQQLAIM